MIQKIPVIFRCYQYKICFSDHPSKENTLERRTKDTVVEVEWREQGRKEVDSEESSSFFGTAVERDGNGRDYLNNMPRREEM